ncbi:MAG: phospholipase A [Campylobacterota bacterium]|nr:phospholipase A [Campylobacterota bacterium]
MKKQLLYLFILTQACAQTTLIDIQNILNDTQLTLKQKMSHINHLSDQFLNKKTPQEKPSKKLTIIKKDPLELKAEKSEFLDFSAENQEHILRLLPHRANYFYPVSYDDYDHNDSRTSTEAKFQLSFKLPLYHNLLNTGANLYAAYTQTSFFQVFNVEDSRPFRQMNHTPEIFLDWDVHKDIFGWNLEKIRLSATHQSNGGNIERSRSWNYTSLETHLKKDNLTMGAMAWYRWDEKKKTSPTDTMGDDNPDLEKYIGKQKLFIKYKYNRYIASLTHQNNFHHYSKHKGNTIVELIFPSWHRNFDIIFQYFHGYGESLIDYNEKVNKVSLGILINDW